MSLPLRGLTSSKSHLLNILSTPPHILYLKCLWKRRYLSQQLRRSLPLKFRLLQRLRGPMVQNPMLLLLLHLCLGPLLGRSFTDLDVLKSLRPRLLHLRHENSVAVLEFSKPLELKPELLKNARPLKVTENTTLMSKSTSWSPLPQNVLTLQLLPLPRLKRLLSLRWFQAAPLLQYFLPLGLSILTTFLHKSCNLLRPFTMASRSLALTITFL